MRRDRAVAVRASFPGGEGLAALRAEVYSPTDPIVPHWKGTTDRNGWLAFVPDVPGRWRVRIVDSTGHGLDTTVEVAAPLGAGPTPSGPASADVVLRPVLGVALVAAIFGLLYLRGRRRTS